VAINRRRALIAIPIVTAGFTLVVAWGARALADPSVFLVVSLLSSALIVQTLLEPVARALAPQLVEPETLPTDRVHGQTAVDFLAAELIRRHGVRDLG
jgi:hypothetical protein